MLEPPVRLITLQGLLDPLVNLCANGNVYIVRDGELSGEVSTELNLS